MNKNILILLGVIFLSLSCQNTVRKTKVKSPEIHFKKEGVLQVQDSLGHTKASFDIELADNDYEHQTGLMYRKQMQDNQAMLFLFKEEQPRYFYMKNTYIPLDIIYADADKQIVHIAKEAKALDETTLPSGKAAKYVLEIKAGLSDTYNLHPGDKLSWKTL